MVFPWLVAKLRVYISSDGGAGAGFGVVGGAGVGVGAGVGAGAGAGAGAGLAQATIRGSAISIANMQMLPNKIVNLLLFTRFLLCFNYGSPV